MKDRFTQAFRELEEKNPYVCESCEKIYGHPTIEHFTGDVETTDRNWDPEDILNPDPRPFSD